MRSSASSPRRGSRVSSGVLPRLFAALTFAPLRMSTSTAFSWPRKAAACRAVPPSRPAAFTSAPRSMSSSTASARPATAAQSNGVPPRSGSTASTATPLARCRSMAPRSPARAAAQMFDAPSAGAAPPGFREADDIARRGDPDRERDDGEHPRQQGEEHPVEPVLDQRPAASPVEQHRAEEAAHDEEQRHPEAVDGREDDPEAGILPTIRDHPERREEREGSVQDDPQQHGAGPQGVQVGSSGEGGVLGAHGKGSPDPVRYSGGLAD